jgi:hypothetical protein
MAALPGQAMKALYADYSRASHKLGDSDMVTARMLLFTLLRFLDYLARDLVSTYSGTPLLYSYQSDATSCLCAHYATGNIDTHRVIRRGRKLVEFLIERGLVIVNTTAWSLIVRFCLDYRAS